MMVPEANDMVRRALVYATNRGLTLGPQLGAGKDGIVFSAAHPAGGRTVIKALVREDLYQREAACYQRLREHGVTEVCGHNVPRLRGHDAALWVVEMSIVQRPFVLDFASAYVDFEPEFSAEVMEERRTHWMDIFEDRWPRVLGVVVAFRKFGIHLLDLNPGNIAFAAAQDAGGEGDE